MTKNVSFWSKTVKKGVSTPDNHIYSRNQYFFPDGVIANVAIVCIWIISFNLIDIFVTSTVKKKGSRGSRR